MGIKATVVNSHRLVLSISEILPSFPHNVMCFSWVRCPQTAFPNVMVSQSYISVCQGAAVESLNRHICASWMEIKNDA